MWGISVRHPLLLSGRFRPSWTSVIFFANHEGPATSCDNDGCAEAPTPTEHTFLAMVLQILALSWALTCKDDMVTEP